ncbi:MAG: response regulator [Treponema sp.]|jgi:response regulator RpfG family c-di-GMP phosphodiesterase|nr:response regulator [Treponema sp.]
MDSRKNILIIDDEKMNIIALAHYLKPMYEIIVATDGSSGIEAAIKHMPDLILLDIIMPGMTGFDVIKNLKENKETGKIPVIFITGLNSIEDEEKGLLQGAVDYIVKPFNKTIVRTRIETQLKLVEYEHTIERLSNLLGR